MTICGDECGSTHTMRMPSYKHMFCEKNERGVRKHDKFESLCASECQETGFDTLFSIVEYMK